MSCYFCSCLCFETAVICAAPCFYQPSWSQLKFGFYMCCMFHLSTAKSPRYNTGRFNSTLEYQSIRLESRLTLFYGCFTSELGRFHIGHAHSGRLPQNLYGEASVSALFSFLLFSISLFLSFSFFRKCTTISLFLAGPYMVRPYISQLRFLDLEPAIVR